MKVNVIQQKNCIQENISLIDKTWFKTGGLARFFAQPRTIQETSFALEFAQKQQIDLFFLGRGANILMSDDGFDGLVINSQMRDIIINEQTKQYSLVTAGAGTDIESLIQFCLDHNLTGAEEFSGIPGTVGGSVFINLHYFKFLFSDFLVSARVIEIETGNIIEVDNAWFEFGYDTSKLFERKHVVLDATFTFKKTTPLETAYNRGRSCEIIRHRKARYPYENTCGSFFRNFHTHELTKVNNVQPLPYIAYYLDKVGVKGALSVGGAQVSYQHANMIVTQPGATSNDIIQLARMMQEKVKQTFNIIPQPECQLIGFKQYPLL